MRVIDTLPGQVSEELEENLFTLVAVAEVAQGCRYGVEDLVEPGLGTVGVAFFEDLKTHGDIATVTA